MDDSATFIVTLPPTLDHSKNQGGTRNNQSTRDTFRIVALSDTLYVVHEVIVVEAEGVAHITKGSHKGDELICAPRDWEGHWQEGRNQAFPQ